MSSDQGMVEIRHRLHREAERSGEEKATARLIIAALTALEPDEIVSELGGHGVLAVFGGKLEGPSVLLRSDMDALPLPDDDRLPHASIRKGTAHRCGHDGHMAMMVGLAQSLSEKRPRRGRAILLFQPAEETGAGARQVLDDPRFAPFVPDVAIAQHNLPGFELGQVVIRKGVFASASSGLIVTLRGRASHASEPNEGNSPLQAAVALAQSLVALSQQATALHEAAQVTVVGLEVGGPAFGTSPGDGRVMATLRAHDAAVMQRISSRAVELAEGLAAAHGLDGDVSWTDEFPSTVNDSTVAQVVAKVARTLGHEVVEARHPFPWSEDFGHFTAICPGVLFGLGSGSRQPSLHAEGYDFPDELLSPGRDLLLAVVRDYLESA
ncbi:MAG: amidohydrolase [Planctomycetes bacterium]|nr:amidohydrolase [Planctomycetota bacterium]